MEGNRKDVWLKTSEGRSVTGTGWYVHEAFYPDYTKPAAQVREIKSRETYERFCHAYQQHFEILH